MSGHSRQLEAETPLDRTLGDYGSAVYRHRGIILLVTVVSGVSAGIISTRFDPQFESLTEFYVPADVGGPVPGPEEGKPRLPSGERDLAKAYMAILKGLEARKELHERFPGKSISDLNRDADISVNRLGIVQIYVRDPSAQLAADVANGFVQYFDEFNRRSVEGGIGQSLANVEKTIQTVTDRRKDREDQRRRFQEENRVASLGTKLSQLESRYQAFREMRQMAEIDLKSIEEQRIRIDEQLRLEGGAYEAGEFLITSTTLERVRERLVGLELDLAAARVDLKPEHKDVVALERKYEEAKRNYQEEKDRLTASRAKAPGTLYESLRSRQTNLHVDKGSAVARLEALTTATQQLQVEIGTMPNLAVEIERLDRDIGVDEKELAGLRDERNELLRQTLRLRQSVVVIQRAEPMKKPVFPLIGLNVPIAALAGMVAGILYALLLDYIEVRRHVRRLRHLEAQEWTQALVEAVKPVENRGTVR